MWFIPEKVGKYKWERNSYLGVRANVVGMGYNTDL